MTPDEAEEIGARIAEARSWRYDDGAIDLNVLGGLIAAALLEAAGEWNADMDAAPRDGTVIMVWADLIGGPFALTVKYGPKYDDDPFPWRTLLGDSAVNRACVTHWRHLPAPPDVPDATA
jgi:hypothetical protein